MADEKTVNQEQATNNNAESKTFTQEEVNGIVNDRLARERKKYDGVDLEALKTKAAKYDEMEEANKSELEKANARADKLQAELDGLKKADQVREIREKVAKETGIPASLLTADSEEDCQEQAEAIKEFAMPASYPNVRDGGEPLNMKTRSARDEFAAFAQQMMN